VRTADALPDGVRELIVAGREAWRAQAYDEAETLFGQALVAAGRQGDGFGRMSAYHFLGNVAFNLRCDGESRRLHTLALELARADDDDQGIATSLGSIALVDVAQGDLGAARRAFADSEAAYLRADMAEAANRVRETAAALLDEGVPLESLVDRQP